MFDRAIIDTDRFMDLSMSAKALYFLLGMEADDEGFVSYKKVMRIHGGNEDDVKILLAKNFIIGFKSGVVVITDWNKNNWLDSRRIRPTEYQKEKAEVVLLEDKSYSLSSGLASIEESSIEESSIVSESTDSQDISSKEISEVIFSFRDINPNFKRWYANKTQRGAVKELIELMGFDKLIGLIGELPKLSGLQYAPQITTPYEMMTKLPKLELFLKTEHNKIITKKNNLII
jgi:hypothetical protein